MTLVMKAHTRRKIQQMRNCFITWARRCVVMTPLRNRGQVEIYLEYRKGPRMENWEPLLYPISVWHCAEELKMCYLIYPPNIPL